jgi:RNA polymerase sigma factor (sigma-70 family)
MSRGITAHVRALFSRGTVVGLSERQLLDRFLKDRDSTAFEAIVRRHGPMVLGVCRRWLDDPNDADDAFQATFLVLVRKAGRLRDGDLLAAWLHGVATRVARRARLQAYQRRRREAIAGSQRPLADPGATMKDVGPGPELHEELERLPRAYRQVLVLCYLEGRTHEEASRELGWPIGTVKGRLARARDQLRDRLVRRGVQVSAGALMAALEAEAAVVPASLLQATVRAASAAAVSKLVASATISTSVAYLTRETIKTMFLTKMTTIGAVGLLLAGAATTGAVLARGQGQGRAAVAGPLASLSAPSAPDPLAARVRAGEAKTPTPDPVSMLEAQPPTQPAAQDEIAEIQKARLDVARRNYEVAKRLRDGGEMAVGDFQKAEEAVAAAELEVAKSPEERIATLQRIVELRKTSWDMGQQLVRAGRIASTEANALELAYLDARLQLAREKARKAPAPEGAAAAPAQPPVQAGSPAMAQGLGGLGGLGGGAIDDTDEHQQRLASARPFFFKSVDQEGRTPEIEQKLSEPLDIHMPDGSPLRDFLAYVRQVTSDGSSFPKGVPIYLDEASMREHHPRSLTADAEVRIDLDGVALKTVLRLVLKQLDLVYIIKEGLIMISTPEADSFLDEFDDAIDMRRQ